MTRHDLQLGSPMNRCRDSPRIRNNQRDRHTPTYANKVKSRLNVTNVRRDRSCRVGNYGICACLYEVTRPCRVSYAMISIRPSQVYATYTNQPYTGSHIKSFNGTPTSLARASAAS